ncbi:nephrocystin-4-like [Symsagittifera roscoffensis]|uniref:nephrocystin-4-like n=2 Tax=Symsagittifera roscoffensis TaxID=84072 RepID=UPI00307B7FE4
MTGATHHLERVITPSPLVKISKRDSSELRVTIDKIESLVVPSENVSKHMKFAIHATLFSLTSKTAFGNIWSSELISPTENKENFSLKVNEAIYFYTNVQLADACLIIEVAKVNSISNESISCGWTGVKLEPLPGNGSRSQLYYGSARALVSLGKNYPTGLNKIDSSEVYLSVTDCESISTVSNLFEANTLVGKRTILPGVEKQPGVSDFMATPKLSQRVSLYLQHLEMSFNKKLSDISDEVCEKAASDLISELREFEEPGIFQDFLDSFMDTEENETKLSNFGTIAQWKLKIFGHNGFKMINEPQTLELKKIIKVKSEALKYGKEVEIKNLIDHKDCFLMFQLVAVIKLSDELINRKKDRLKELGIDVKEEKSTQKTLHVKQWRFPIHEKNGEVDLESEKFVEIDEFKFVLQSDVEMNLRVRYSKERDPTDRLADESQVTGVDETDLNALKPTRNLESDLNREDEIPIITTLGPAGTYDNKFDEQITFREEELTRSTPRHPTYEMQSPRGVQPVSEFVHDDMRQVQYASPNPQVIALSGMLQRKPLQLSRKSYAEIVSAGFPQPKDDFGNLPSVVGVDSLVKLDMKSEKNDPLVVNEIVIQFLAFSKSTQDLNSHQIGSIFFTFQFYKFPQTVSERLKLTERSSILSGESFKPFILQRMQQDQALANEPPGCLYKFYLDPSVLQSGETECVIKYLASQKLIIDVWNGDSLMHLGSCAVDLKYLLRQGRPATQTTFEYEVLSQEFASESTSMIGDLGTTGSLIRPVNSQKSVKSGHLHMRLVNIGHSRSSQGSLSRSLGFEKSLMYAKTGSVARDLSATTLNRTKKQANRLPEVDRTLNTMLLSEKESLRLTGGKLPEDRDRKLLRMRQMRSSLLANSTGGTLDATKMSKMESLTIQRFEREEKQKELKLIEEYRSATKQNTIHSMLLSDITTEHSVFASFGVAELVEFQFRNPFNEDTFFFIHCGDNRSIRPVTNTKELRLLKALKNSTTPIADIFIDDSNTDENTTSDLESSGIVKIFLKPHELVYIPFKYTSLYADSSMPLVSPISSSDKETLLGDNQNLETSTVKVQIKDPTEKPVSILNLNVVHQPILVDQTFRFSHPEKTVVKKSIRLPPLSAGRTNTHFSGKLIALCSDVNTICTTGAPGTASDPQDVNIKTLTGPSPSVKKFYVSVYEGEFRLAPTQTWMFVIESLKRCDVQCVAGQASRFSLVIKGSGASRLVKVFISDPAEMEVDPCEPFILSSVSLVELEILVRPLRPGNKHFFVNVVDIDYHQKIHSWLINANCSLPQITKAFEIKLPVNGGKGSVKKIPFTNNYPIRKKFHLHTDRSDLLYLGENQKVLESGEECMLGLTFLPVAQRGSTEIILYVNDDDNNNEDTFCIKTTYM